jgi:hypothetical protein
MNMAETTLFTAGATKANSMAGGAVTAINGTIYTAIESSI